MTATTRASDLTLLEATRVERDRLELRVRELEQANRRIADLNAELERRVDEATAELRHAVARLQELDQMKSQFLSIASHELRTPITAVSGFAQLALRGLREHLTLSSDETWGRELERLTRQLTIIHDQSAKLGRLVRELLDVSRIQAGRLEFQLAPVDLAEVARTVTEQVQMMSPDHRFHVDAQGSAAVMGDRDHLEQAVANLLDNAIKYSAEGGSVRVRVRREDDEVRCTIEDEGIGISPEQIGRIFDIFYRTTEAEARRTAGLGLGLFITRGIVERHGGRIWAESEVGKGTRVHFALPPERAAAPEQPEVARPAAGAAAG